MGERGDGTEETTNGELECLGMGEGEVREQMHVGRGMWERVVVEEEGGVRRRMGRESIVEGEDEVVVSGRQRREQWGRCREEEECRQLLYGEESEGGMCDGSLECP